MKSRRFKRIVIVRRKKRDRDYPEPPKIYTPSMVNNHFGLSPLSRDVLRK